MIPLFLSANPCAEVRFLALIYRNFVYRDTETRILYCYNFFLFRTLIFEQLRVERVYFMTRMGLCAKQL